VTLLSNSDGTYPNPSGAGEAAKIFCEKAIERAERLYAGFSEKNVLEVFSYANEAIETYNQENGRTKETVNFGTFDFFHVTAAFALIKEDKVFWGTVCDSGVIMRSAQEEKFKSPPCSAFNKLKPSQEYSAMNREERKAHNHKFFRNKLDGAGNPVGYGVLTGEREVMKYVQHGTLRADAGDLLFVFTDGFESYVELPAFINIFNSWPSDIQKRVEDFTSMKTVEDHKLFGHERTLIAVKM